MGEQRTQAPGTTSPEEQLAALIPALVRRSGSGQDPELRKALRQMCETAHARGWRAEQLILELKHIWSEARRSAHRRDVMAEQVLLDRAVTYCIEEFYRSS